MLPHFPYDEGMMGVYLKQWLEYKSPCTCLEMFVPI